MATTIGTVNISSGKFFIKDLSGKVIQLQEGDIITKWMTVFGDKANAASDSMVIRMESGVTIVLNGSYEQLFDASTIDAIDVMDGAVAPENIEAALALTENAPKEKDVPADVDGDEEEDDNAKNEYEGEVVIAARSGELVDVESQTRDSSFSEETQAGEDETHKNTDRENVLLDRNNPTVDVISNLREDNYIAPVSISNETVQPIPDVVNPTTSVNDAPVAVVDSATVAEDGSVVIDVTANDTDVDGTIDPTTVVITTQPTNGTVAVNATTGEVTYTPNPDYFGADSFEYTVEDNDGLVSEPATVSLTVTSVNDAPVAVVDVITATEDTPFTSTIDLDANDTDLDGDALTVVAGTFTTAQGGEIVIATDGSYTYTPALNFNGTDTVDYTVTDGALTDVGTLTITVNPVDDATTTVSDTGSTNEDTTLTVDAASGVLSNDSDVDTTLSVATFTVAGDMTVYIAGTDIATVAGVGTLTMGTDGSYEFIPATDYSGSVPEVTYTLNSGSSDTLNITVIAVADMPTITTGVIDYTVNTFNANFEGSNGLDGWTTGGTVVVESNSLADSDLGPLTSAEGTQHVLLRAEGTDYQTIAAALGVTAADLEAASNNSNPTYGSYIETQVYAQAGDVITVQYNFINTETSGYSVSDVFDDFAVAVVNGVTTTLSNSSDLANDNLDYDSDKDVEVTGWQTFTYTATSDGYVDLGFAIMNAGDDTIDAYMMVDNVQINGEDPRITTFDLNLDVDLADTDGSESLTVVLSDFPAGTTFSVGGLDANGGWVITLAAGENLTGVQATLPAGYTGAFDYHVTAVATDSNGDTATAENYFTDERYLAHAPTLTMSIDAGTLVTESISYADDFNTDLGDWTGSNISLDNNAMRIDGNGDSATNNTTYDFGVAHAFETVTISFNTDIESNKWDGLNLITGLLSTDDQMNIYINGNATADYTKSAESDLVNGASHSFTAVLDENGQLAVEIVNNSTSNNEDLWIDNFTVTLPVDVYKYELALDAGLTDSSETLSSVTLTNIPVDVTLQDSSGVEIVQNGDGSYTATLDGNGDAIVSILSPDTLTAAEKEAITSSVTSTDDTGDVVTTTIGGSLDDSIVYGIGDSIDGGLGSDTITIEADLNLDFSDANIANHLSNIEQIDLTDGDHTIVNLSLDDVLTMTDSNNTLTITGDASDSVGTVDTTGWSPTTTQVNGDGTTTYVYSNDTTSDSLKLTIDDNVDNTAL